MKATEFIEMAKYAASCKTLYVKGGFGAPLTQRNKDRYIRLYNYNMKRAASINAASEDTFAFDCVCLVKGLCWGWNGDTSAVYGGAEYKKNNIPDFTVDGMLDYCDNVSDDFSTIIPGEVLWMEGHVGIYVGAGLVIEATAAWQNKVQVSALGNWGPQEGYPTRSWKKHGKLQFLEYDTELESKSKTVKIELPILKKGAEGEAVKSLQILLNGKQHFGMAIDGIFGPVTEQFLRDYQKAHGLEVDGSCGPATWASLF